jgi:exodeoxyribonuclease VII large subunit
MVEDRRERLTLTQRALGDPARVIEPLLQRLDEKSERLTLAWQSGFERRQSRVAEAAGKLRHPRDLLALAAQRLAHLDQRRQGAFREKILRWEKRLENLTAELKHLSPRAVLGRGYALVQDAAGRVVTSRKNLRKGDPIRIEFHDGAKGAVVEGE